MRIQELAFILLLSPVAAAQTALHGVFSSTGGNLGHSIENAGFINGDGYEDFVVGMPLVFGGRGGVKCFSGGLFAHGINSGALLWEQIPGLVASDYNLGWSVARLSDMNGDGRSEFAVGAPNYDNGTADTGAVFLLDGLTGQMLNAIYGNLPGGKFGYSLDEAGDLNGDGLKDLVVGAPFIDNGSKVDVGGVYTVSGAALFSGSSFWAFDLALGPTAGERLGFSVLGSVNLDGDSDRDIVAGAPYFDLASQVNNGAVRTFDGPTLTPHGSFYGSNGDYLGWTLDGFPDFDGDHRPDIIAGAPYSDVNGTNSGRVIVLSGQKVYASVWPPQIRDWRGAVPGALFGSAVAWSHDINDDGTSDILIGASGYEPAFVGDDNGAVYTYSGATLEKMGTLIGDDDQSLGDAFARTAQDWNGDGAREFLACGSTNDVPVAGGGSVVSVSLFPTSASSYCTSKTNSLGCTPSMGSTGKASANPAMPYTVRAVNVINNKFGILFYGFAPNGAPFQGGTLCVLPPTHRTPVLSSGGSASGADCTGVFSIDFNKHIRGGTDPELVLGQEVFVQCWSRDPASASTTSLTNGLRFVINP